MTTTNTVPKLTEDQIVDFLQTLDEEFIKDEAEDRGLLSLSNYDLCDLEDEINDRGYTVIHSDTEEDFDDAIAIVTKLQEMIYRMYYTVINKDEVERNRITNEMIYIVTGNIGEHTLFKTESK
jgi:hypothetical protein